MDGTLLASCEEKVVMVVVLVEKGTGLEPANMTHVTPS